VLSPLLSNLYLDKLDTFVASTLIPTYTRGDRRRANPRYRRLLWRARRLQTAGRYGEARDLRRQAQRLPSLDVTDPAYRRLRYVRYADDMLLGFIGPRNEAEEIKQRLGTFLRDQLKLTLSEQKTLITHARTQAARFLGYEIVVRANDIKHDQRGHRSINGQIGLKVPMDVVRTACDRYLRQGKPIHRKELINDSPYSIVARFQQEYRGLVEYYQLAYNLHRLNRLKWVMEQALTKTLAHKLRLSVPQVYARFQTTVQTERGSRRVLEVKVERGHGKTPLIAHWGNVSLTRRTHVILNDHPQHIRVDRTELEQRLLAETCEWCGSHDAVEVHHVRGLKDLQRKGRGEKPQWVQIMAARRRKTLAVCRVCHDDIHAGRRRRRQDAKIQTLESGVR
jgi:AI2M/AI1M-like HNH endonuclease/type II intron maturase